MRTDAIEKEDITKAEKIEQLCSAALDKEKASKRFAEIIHNKNEVIVKVKKRIIGHIVEINNELKFQYLINL